MKISAGRLLILFSVCLNIGFIGYAGYAFMDRTIHKKGPGRFAHIRERVIEEMNLSPGQKREVNLVIDKNMAEMGKIKHRAREKKLALLDLMGVEGTPDPEVVKAQFKEITAMEMELEKMKFQHIARIRKVMEPEQAREFFRLLAKYIRERSGHHRGGSEK